MKIPDILLLGTEPQVRLAAKAVAEPGLDLRRLVSPKNSPAALKEDDGEIGNRRL